ncbi:recombinase family protein [Methylobacterium sp. E-041]|uniref:recombinase family protein n=1 Tax=Methylobacterium sp. E-041 TaxID=2836573 RepID=UPI001FB8C85A|nr:recombinase family protein [Methylobacterium sp. E-041]MCJ2109211.1 recombinase family protein [Methylobacterium sp. E-041]
MDQMNENGAALPARTFGTRLSNRTRRRREGADLTKCVIYARYSTTEQTEVSIERQVEVCNGYARDRGLTVEAVFVDRAKSGAYAVGRVGLENMVKGAKAGKFGVLLIENGDRLARDLGILSTTYKQLANMGVEMHQPGRGRLSLQDIAFQGLMGDEQRRIMGERSQYARNVMAREGRVPAGASLGYDRVPGQPGVLVVNEAQADVVRRMYDMRLQGLSITTICTILASEGFVYPKSGRLSHHGVMATLQREIYAGLIVYGRHHTQKDRDTGKVTVSVRDPEHWITVEAPELRIVEQGVWEKVQALGQAQRRGHRPERAVAEGSSFMLTGLVPCPGCDRTLAVAGGQHEMVRYGCLGHIRHGTCAYDKTVNVQKLERVVLGLVCERLDEPGFVDAYLDAYNEENARAELQHVASRTTLERQVTQLNNKLLATFDDAYTKGFRGTTLAKVRANVEEDLEKAEVALAALPRRPHPATVDRAKVASLRATIETVRARAPFRPVDEAGKVLVASVREIVERIDVDVTGRGLFDVAVRLRVAPLADTPILDTGRLGSVVLRGGYDGADGRYQNSLRAAADRERQAKGEFSLTEGDRSAIEDFLSGQRFRGGIARARNRFAVIEAMLFVVKTGAPWHSLHGDGRPMKLYTWALILDDRGLWDGIARLLAERDPVRYGHLPGHPRLLSRRKFRIGTAKADASVTAEACR